MIIGKRQVGMYLSPYIIAEIGVNHEGSLDLAKELIDQAAEGGVHGVKFQYYKAERLASRNSPAYWDTTREPTLSQYELFKKYDAFGPREYELLADHCGKREVDFLCTPFDTRAVDELDPLVPAFKIASADITNLPLLRKVARSGKPVLLSTGAATLPEIEFAKEVLQENGAPEIALLHCVLNYPTDEKHAQLFQIRVLQGAFPDCLVGYSDHVVPDETVSALEMAALLGASILEKHFTHDKTLPGNDHYHAMNALDLKRFLAKLKKYRSLLGKESKDVSLEKEARSHARRSIVALKNIGKGEVLTEENITVKRPGHGISPLLWDSVIGRRATREIREDALLQW
ncbi:MAG: N-acetylneuraminate synthase family protein, partial [Deltaproteobacteria bacterium]|nr:N-acetylneuraminate synthase family protein [Deltaproteobacteria bacterium]